MSDDVDPYLVPGPRPDDAETIDATPAPPGGPVDPAPRKATYADLVTRANERRPIVPASLRSKAGRHAMRVWALALVTHVSLYHLTRSPKYAYRLTWYTLRGVFVGLGRVVHWASAEEGNYHLRQQAATRDDPKMWLMLDRQRQKQSVFRWPLVLVTAVAVAGATAAVRGLAPQPWWWAYLTAAVLLLARVGQPADRPLLDRVFTGSRFVRLTAELTRAAIVATGKVKEPKDIQFRLDIGRDGPGHRALVELPPGVIATDIIDKREQLAAGFRLPHDQVWPATVRGEHPGVLEIWVADKPISAMKQPKSPLLGDLVTDYFEPFPYGVDVRLNQVSWALDERNSLFGGIPGSGKSLAARNVMLGAVLDPLVIPIISELAGKGDYDMFEQLCPKGMYVCGADDRSIERTLNLIEWLDALCEERGPLVAKYARQGMNTVKKVNRRMAEHDERLRPVVAMFDEIQEFMTSPWGMPKGKNPPDGAGMLLSVIKRARALGIHCVVATQRFDKDSLPKAISSLVANRAALSVPAQPETDMILGTSSYRAGARPTAFVPGEDSGWMVRAGFRPGFETVRASFIDDQAAAAICTRALELRSGAAAKVTVKGTVRNLLVDVRMAWPRGEDALWSELIVPRLQSLDPDVYGDLTVEIFGARMAAAGVPTVQLGRRIDGKSTTRKGVRLDALDRALDGKPPRREISQETAESAGRA